MSFASVRLRAGLPGLRLQLRCTPQRTFPVPRSFSTHLNGSLLRPRAVSPVYQLSRRTYASKTPLEETLSAASTVPESEKLPLIEATSDPLASVPTTISDTLNQAIPPLAYGDLAQLGLSSWSPIGIIDWSFELIQVTTQMPWFWTIVSGAAFWRLVCVPFAISAIRGAARIRKYQPRIVKIQEKITEARGTKDVVAMQRAALEMKQVYAEAKVNPVTSIVLPNLAQLPITIGFFFALKRLCQHPVEQLRDSGVSSWFWANDLTLMDPTYILPVVFTALVNIQISVGGRDADTAGNPATGHLLNLFRAFSILGGFLMSTFPAGLLVGLVTTSGLTIGQSLLLRNTAIRNALGIPIIPKSEHGKVPSFMDSIRFAREKWLEAGIPK
ncbi:hypothetical protein H1R20_g3857, partial [Candolleomyces eurysporus]